MIGGTEFRGQSSNEKTLILRPLWMIYSLLQCIYIFCQAITGNFCVREIFKRKFIDTYINSRLIATVSFLFTQLKSIFI